MGVVDDFKPRPDLPYMTPGEAAVFKKYRKAGIITFFRTSRCEVCGSEVPKPKRYCGPGCYERATNGEKAGEHGEMD